MDRLGSIPLARIRTTPPIGSATESDVVLAEAAGHLCELVDGTLVEKAMGFEESLIASELIYAMKAYCKKHKSGVVAGPDGMLRLFSRLVRIPDVAYISWSRIPDRKALKVAVGNFVPDLVVEVLSTGNTRREMERKRAEYFRAGVRVVWIVDAVSRTVDVYRPEADVQTVSETETLTGGDLMPGFSLPLTELFDSDQP